MAKRGKIWVSILVLFLVLYSNSRDINTDVIVRNTITRYSIAEVVRELHTVLHSSGSAEHALTKLKMKVRYKCGESPMLGGCTIIIFRHPVYYSVPPAPPPVSSIPASPYICSFITRGPPATA